MKVRFITAVAGDGFHFVADEVASLPEAMAADFCKAGFCLPIAEPAEVKKEKASTKAKKETR
jgi:hypothetical protein